MESGSFGRRGIGVELLAANRLFLHMEVRLANGRRWALMAVYASPKASVRQYLWRRLEELEVELRWVLIGDFNCILWSEERSSKTGVSSSFKDWVDRNGLIDIGYVGSCYTWSHGTSVETRRAARMDRALS